MKRRHFTFAGFAFALATCLPAVAAQPLELFGVKLKTATRTEMRQALRQAGARATREEDQYFADLYEAQSLLKGARQLQMTYTGAQQFAAAGYFFAARSTDEYLELHSMLEQKYGKPRTVSGDPKKSFAEARWVLPDDMEIAILRQEYADPGIALIYSYRPHYETWARESAAAVEAYRKRTQGNPASSY